MLKIKCCSWWVFAAATAAEALCKYANVLNEAKRLGHLWTWKKVRNSINEIQFCALINRQKWSWINHKEVFFLFSSRLPRGEFGSVAKQCNDCQITNYWKQHNQFDRMRRKILHWMSENNKFVKSISEWLKASLNELRRWFTTIFSNAFICILARSQRHKAENNKSYKLLINNTCLDRFKLWINRE